MTCCEWLNSNDLFFAVSSNLIHWNTVDDNFKIVYEVFSKCITCIAISKSQPVLIAVRSETDQIIVFRSNEKCFERLFTFCMEHEICSISFSFQNDPQDRCLLAAVAKSGDLKVWHLFSDHYTVLVDQNFGENQPLKVKKLFTLSFIPKSLLLDTDSANDRKDSEKDEGNNSTSLVIGFPQGHIKILCISNGHLSNLPHEYDLIDLDPESKYFHTSTVLNFAINNPYVNKSSPLNSCKEFLHQSDINKDKGIPLIAVSLSADRQIIFWDMKKLKGISKAITSEQTRSLAFCPCNHSLLAIASKSLLLWKVEQR